MVEKRVCQRVAWMADGSVIQLVASTVVEMVGYLVALMAAQLESPSALQKDHWMADS